MLQFRAPAPCLSARSRRRFSTPQNGVRVASFAPGRPGAAVTFPLELPIFPVQPVGVFIPGMTKTLHLYEPHFLALLEEAQAQPHKLMCIAVMEPFLGKAEQAAGLGSYIGGSNCVFSCACLVKVLSSRPYMGGSLVQIRGEARLGISTVLQVDPYLRARVYSLPDMLPTRRELEGLPAAVEALDDVMRGVQLLASKFRCDETAAIQQAFRYVNESPLVPNIQEPLPTLTDQDEDGDPHHHQHLQGAAQQSPGRPAVAQIVLFPADAEPCSLPVNGSNARGAQQGVADMQAGSRRDALQGTAEPQSHVLASSPERLGARSRQAPAPSPQVVTPSQQVTPSQHVTPPQQGTPSQQQQPGGGAAGPHTSWHDEGEEDEEPLDLQRASRLSYASLQWLPESTTEERYEVMRGRLLAMEAITLSERLGMVTQIMDAARASLAAKCALKAMR